MLTAASAALLQCGGNPPEQHDCAAVVIVGHRDDDETHRSPPPPPPTLAPAAVHPVTAAELGASWRPGCPVGPDLLRRVEVNYLGFDGQTHRGELIVHRDVAADVIAILGQLYELGYPIAKMRTVADYPGAEDELSMRGQQHLGVQLPSPAVGSNTPSMHAYGRAIDVNPLSTRTSTATATSSRRPPGRTWTAPAPTPACCMRAIPRCVPSPTAVGAGAVTGAAPRTISISNAISPHIECNAGARSPTTNDAPVRTGASGRETYGTTRKSARISSAVMRVRT